MRRKQLYDTPSKIIYEGPEPDSVIQHFLDGGPDDGTGDGRGVLNNRISEYFYRHLEEVGMATHFIRRVNMREQQLRRVETMPVAIMIRSVVDGTMASRLGIAPGTRLHRPVVEFMLNDHRLVDPLITDEHIANFGWVSPPELDEMIILATRAHDLISGMLMACGYSLVDLRLEFGRFLESHAPRPGAPDEIRDEVRVVLCGDLSPDTMRLFDRGLSEPLETTGYDVWRSIAAGSPIVEPSKVGASVHQDIAAKLGLLPQASPIDMQGPATLQ